MHIAVIVTVKMDWLSGILLGAVVVLVVVFFYMIKNYLKLDPAMAAEMQRRRMYLTNIPDKNLSSK